VDKLGKYTVLERIGEGGMAEVFRARLDGPMGFQKEAAVKKIRASIIREEGGEHVRSLINEARIGGLLKHPNIVEIYELGEQDGAYYIGMELVDGLSLGEALMESRDSGWLLPKNVALDIAIQVCAGLSYAHRFEVEASADASSGVSGVVHRDLKPSNIMITRGGTAKIMDFGIAKSDANLFDTTATGIAKGTPLYMSPEQLRGKRPLPTCSDLFSLGTILYEMITGRLLFAGRTIPEIITRVLNQPLQEKIQEVDERIPGLGPVIARLLDRDIAARFKDASDVAIELRHVLDWQEKKTSTAQFAQDFLKGQWRPDGSLVVRALHPEDLEGDPDEPPTKPARGKRRKRPGSETIVSQYLAHQRRRRLSVTLLLLVLIGAIGVAGWFVYQGTLGVALGVDAGRSALQAGDLGGALETFLQQEGAQPGRHEARFAATAVASLKGLSEPERAALIDRLAALPEEEPDQHARKHRAIAAIHRDGRDYRLAMKVTKDAIDRARIEEKNHGTAVPAVLLWDAGELTLLRGAPDASRAYFRELGELLPPGPLGDAAAAYEERLAAGEHGALRAELLYRAGDPAAFEGLEDAMTALGKGPKADDARMVWAWRAMNEQRWERAWGLAEPALHGATPTVRAQVLGVKATWQASSGKPDRARRTLDAATAAAPGPDLVVALQLQVARALTGDGDSAGLRAQLLEQLTVELGGDDPDLAAVRSQATDAATPPFAVAEQLSWDPRTSHLFRSRLLRGTPSGSRLVAGVDWEHHNVTDEGLPWPFGPTWHPIDLHPLPIFFHPRR